MIALLHSTPAVVPTFDAAAKALGVAVTHAVRDELLREAEAAGGLTDAIRARTAEALRALAPGADAVLLTCSTLGPAVAGTGALRVDAALAREAKARGGRCAVLCAVETTLGPTREIFAAEGVADFDLRLVEGAWAAFRAGEPDRYRALIRAAAEAALAEGAGCVALAQASMAGAAGGHPDILASPEAGLRAAAERARKTGRAA